MVEDRTRRLPDIPLSPESSEPPGPLASDRDLDPAFPLHHGGKIEVRPTVRVRDKGGLALAYTPGVARVSSAVAAEPGLAYDYTLEGQHRRRGHRRHRGAGPGRHRPARRRCR